MKVKEEVIVQGVVISVGLLCLMYVFRDRFLAFIILLALLLLMFGLYSFFWRTGASLLKRLFDIGQPGTLISSGILLGAIGGFYVGMLMENLALGLLIGEAAGFAFGTVAEEQANPKRRQPEGDARILFVAAMVTLGLIILLSVLSLIFGW